MKAIVTSVVKMDKKDSYGNTSFKITLDNGDSGFYNSKNENQTAFVPQKEVEYNIEKKVGSTGREYFKITLPKSEQPFFRGGKPDPKVQMISFAASYTKDLVIAGKIDMQNFEKEFTRMYTLMISKL
jgi:hypothetical protein